MVIVELSDGDWLDVSVVLSVWVVDAVLVAVDEPVSVWLGVETWLND